MIRRRNSPAADGQARRQIAYWRRVTARLQVLVNTGAGCSALTAEAPALRRQCQCLADELGRLATVPHGAPTGAGAGSTGTKGRA